MKGIILAGGAGTRLHPITQAVSKQLLPVYDKPMIYYPLSLMMFARVREVLIISTPQDLPLFRRLLGTGERFGMRFAYAEQPSPDGLPQAFLIGEAFLNGEPAGLILGDNILYGNRLQASLREAATFETGARALAYYVRNPEDYGVAVFDEDDRVIDLEEKPSRPRSHYAVPGIYFFDEQVVPLTKTLKPSKRGELEITDLLRLYMDKRQLEIVKLGRGMAWLDMGTNAGLLDACNFIHAIEERQGLKIACLEEIAWRQGWIDSEQLRQLADSMGRSAYGHYLRDILP